MCALKASTDGDPATNRRWNRRHEFGVIWAVGDSAKGKVLTNDKGMTLYVFDKDSGGKSACNGPCAGNWPPLMAAAGPMQMGDYSVITRDDGSKQWAYKGHPLYTWKDDKKPGDITGDGFANGVWHIAQP